MRSRDPESWLESWRVVVAHAFAANTCRPETTPHLSHLRRYMQHEASFAAHSFLAGVQRRGLNL